MTPRHNSGWAAMWVVLAMVSAVCLTAFTVVLAIGRMG